MDPNVCLSTIRDRIVLIQGMVGFASSNDLSEVVSEITELFNSLDSWLSQGGLMPLAWENFGGLKQ